MNKRQQARAHKLRDEVERTIFEPIRATTREIEGGQYDEKKDDPLADVDWKEEWAWGTKDPVPFALAFEGAGYQWLSEEADWPSDRLEKIGEIAKRHGFEMDHLNNWSVGFWPA